MTTTALFEPNRSGYRVAGWVKGIACVALCLGAPLVLAQPTLTKQPSALSVSVGATAQFRVTATTTNGPLAYQWRHTDLPLAWATNVSLTLTNVQTSDAGLYSVAVTDATGTTNSQPASLDVDPTFTKITTGALVTDRGHWHGAAWADYDNDGYPDLFINEQAPVAANYLYHNNGDGTFTRLTAPLPPAAVGAWAWGNAWGDYDNDGHLDLFISNDGGVNVLLHNRGDGTFEQIRTGPGAEALASSGAAWGDYDRDGYLDLVVINSDLAQSSGRNTLYQNQGSGSFQKMTANQVGSIVSDMAPWIGAGWVDFNDDGWPDLFVVAYANKAPLYDYENLANGRFGLATNNALTAAYRPSANFAWADYDNAGRLDVCIAGIATPTLLFHQEPDGTFKQMSGTNVGIPPSDLSQYGAVAWGDYDNDGFVDLFVGGGFWSGPPGAGVGPIETKSFLYHNNGDGTFTPVRTGSPVNDLCDTMGVHWVDYNRDGFLDLFVQAHGDLGYLPNLLYRNNGNSNNWLCVNCVGTASPRFGTGAKVRALATIRGKPMWQLRLIDSGGTDWGGQSFVAHFGLGDATNVDTLRIEWSSGIVQELHNVPARQYLTVTEPAMLSMPQPGLLQIQCWKNMVFDVLTSTNLLDWVRQATVTNLNLTGGIQWTDPDAPGQSMHFYRAIKQ